MLRRLGCHYATGIFHLHYNLVGPPLYMQSIVAQNIIMWLMTSVNSKGSYDKPNSYVPNNIKYIKQNFKEKEK